LPTATHVEGEVTEHDTAFRLVTPVGTVSEVQLAPASALS
jgi:hypothetical protein